jgi:pimeloyl-ACP methyl ester carboxylesterase
MNKPQHKARLLLLPGLGADKRMFGPQQDAFPNLEVPAWIDPLRRESLNEYAKRMAESMAASISPSIDAHEPFYLGGASFGGMAALAIASHLKPRAVFLLGSCRDRRAVAMRLRIAAHVGSRLPDAVINIKSLIPPWRWSVLAELDYAQRCLYCQMITDISPRFLKWAAGAIARWDGVHDLDMPIHHIHGQNDGIIRTAHVHANRIVPTAGHLVSNSHADQVNAFIVEMMGQTEASG